MPQDIPESLLARLSELIELHLGLSFPRDRWRDIQRAVSKAATSLGCSDLHVYAQRLLEAPWGEAQVEVLARYLTIGETHFFRHEKVFEVLEDSILPELAASRRFTSRHLRMWSAGCATGEEPYSIAMVLDKVLSDMSRWDVTVLATDVNRDHLSKAAEAVYSQWSFRTVPPGIKERYFSENEGRSAVIPAIRNMITLAYLNLAKDVYPSPLNNTEAMDVIFCRNVLMYFSPQTQQRVVNNLSRCLRDGGWLIVSPAEASCVMHPDLTTVNHPGVIMYRKGAKGEASTCQPTRAFLLPPVQLVFQPAPVSGSSSLDEPGKTCVEVPPLVWASRDRSLPLKATPPASMEKDCPAPTQPQDDPFRDGIVLFEKGAYSAAAEKFLLGFEQSRYRNGEAVIAMSLLASAFANQGKLDEALEWAEKTIREDKLNPVIHHLHGTILQEQGRIDEAVAAMTRAVFLDPDLVVAHFALGNLARQTGRPKDAERHYRVALKILSDYDDQVPVPESGGMTAGRLMETILATTTKETLNGQP